MAGLQSCEDSTGYCIPGNQFRVWLLWTNKIKGECEMEGCLICGTGPKKIFGGLLE